MFGVDVAFNKPWYLLLLAGLPLLWYFSFRSISGLGRVRRFFALGLRSLVFVLLVFCLAEIQLRHTSERVTVIYVLDQSESIPRDKRAAMVQYVVKDVVEHRNAARGDRAGVVVFGREAAIEVPPYDDSLPIQQGRLEAMMQVRSDATNLEGALKLAQASFSEDTAKRIVIVTDGNETLGDSQNIARQLSENGIGIDVVPVALSSRAEVAVEKITLPSDIRKGQPVQVNVVLNNMTEATTEDDGKVKGKVIVVRKHGKREDVLIEQPMELEPGKKVLTFEHAIDEPDFYTYEARFVPDDRLDDSMAQNNLATAFAHVRGEGSVLIIEDWENVGDFDFLIERLRANNINVETMPSNGLFTSLAELQRYDCVIMADVPRASGGGAGDISSFSDQQIEMLVRNTQQMGCGLLMIGGPRSFGAGGWSNTELEKAMPVDFNIKDAKVVPVGALVMMMHASELAQGNYWQKVVAREALKALGPQDYCGLIHWSGTDQWMWGVPDGLLPVGPNRNQMVAKLNRMTPGDMPQFDPAMRMSLAGFNAIDARGANVSIRHMIVISDGDPSPPNPQTVRAFIQSGVKITTVAIGTHGPAGSTPLRQLAAQTGGKYYAVTDPKALPRIYQREARRIAQPLIKDSPGMLPITYPHEVLEGIDGFPSFDGYVMTTLKENALVDVGMVAPVPPEHPENATLLATWTYGVGRSGVLTTDAGKRWANKWTAWEGYDKFFTQLVRYSMRPTDSQSNYTVASEVKDGMVRVVVTATDEDDQYLNFLKFSGTAIDPDMESKDFQLEQVASGRYIGEFPADSSGSYFLSILPSTGGAPIRTGANVPYSAEFRQQRLNSALVEGLASLTPTGGEAGTVIDGDFAIGRVEELLAVDTFRHTLPKAISSQHIWPILLVLCGLVFFEDVFVRRVTIGTEWVGHSYRWMHAKIFGAPETEGEEDRMERLRMIKERATADYDDRKATSRFEVGLDHANGPSAVDEELAAKTPTSQGPPKKAQSMSETPEEDSYTSRLLKAKKQARKRTGGSGDENEGT
ncbi:VWA domain-containing protein [Bremerella cremea]|uniref:VWA domain-containing protein n=1 Tax=Bremerella cremea TaxID=1031537 RepID=UPI0031E7C4FB